VIVGREGEDLLLVRQADHGLLSGWLAAAWGAPPWQAPEPRDGTVVGARLHDLAWTPYDEELPRRPDGRPLAFHEVSRVVTTRLYLRGLAAVEAMDPYAGLLGSLHYTGFYVSHWGWRHWARPSSLEGEERAAVDAFIAHELERQRRLRRQLELGEEDELRLRCNYFWLQLWDRISLDVCRYGFGGHAEDYPAVPVGYDPPAPQVRLRIELRSGGVCRLRPYPLLPNPYQARVPRVRIPAAATAPGAEDDLRRAWLSGGGETVDVRFEG
jgi:hypothetical protein